MWWIGPCAWGLFYHLYHHQISEMHPYNMLTPSYQRGSKVNSCNNYLIFTNIRTAIYDNNYSVYIVFVSMQHQ